MSATPLDQIMAEGAAAEAAARTRDAQDAAIAEAALAANQPLDLGASGADAPQAPSAPTPAAPSTPTSPQQAPATRRVDEPGGIRDDDFGLDGDMGDAIARALEDRFNPPSADTAATPDPATDPTQPAPTPAPGGEGAGVGGAAEGVAAAPLSAAPDPGAPPDDFSLDQYARDYFGVPLTREQSAHLFSIVDNFNRMSPEQRMAVDQILAGRGPSAVQPVTPSTPEPPGQLPPSNVGVPAPYLPPRPGDHDPEAQAIYDQYIAPLATAQHQQLEALRADIARTTATQQEQIQQAHAARIDAAQSAWRAEHPLISDGEFDALTARVVRSGTFMPLVHAHHGDVEAATRAIFDQHFWSDPNLRERAMANASSGRNPVTGQPDPASTISADQQQLEDGRRALAASVAGGGGHIPQRVPTAPTTKEGRQAAMVSEIAAAMEQ